jgi:hypothetical protein
MIVLPPSFSVGLVNVRFLKLLRRSNLTVSSDTVTMFPVYFSFVYRIVFHSHSRYLKFLFCTMSSALQPSYAVVATIKTSINSTLATELPAEVRANVIASLLAQVNQWSTQIPAMLEVSTPPLPVNLVFAIRKELFVAPLFVTSTLGVAIPELPVPFQEFLAFIASLIEAQKSDKEKPIVKVRFLYFLAFSRSHILF